MRVMVMAAVAALATGAGAQAAPSWIDEARIGVLDHDISVISEGAGGKEEGPNVQLELVFESPDALRWAFSPRPFVNWSINTAGDTNFGGAGLAWTTNRDNAWYAELDFGIVTHDGVVDLPEDPGDPVRIRLDQERVVFGSRELFRTAVGVGRRVTDRVDALLVFEHLSHGQILGDGKNEGLDNLGVRIHYRFD